MSNQIYYPPAKSKGTWRRPANDKELKSLCGLKREQLDIFAKLQEFFYAGETYGIAIVRNGYLAAEYYAPDMRPNSLIHVYSCSKAMTSLVFGILLEEKKKEGFSLDSKAYDYMPKGTPLTDGRKKDITIRQLLAMSSGIPGEHTGALGIYGILPQESEIDYILGCIKGTDGSAFEKLAYDPGTSWDYSCAGYALLSLVFQNVAGCSMADYARKKFLGSIGVEEWFWESFGGYNSPIYTAGEEGFNVSLRDFARIGYLLLQDGVWEGTQIIPADYIKEAVAPSQPYNSNYGLGFWNKSKESGARIPKDAFFMVGHKSNRLYVIPSLDMVIARVGMGPNVFNDDDFVNHILAAIEDV